MKKNIKSRSFVISSTSIMVLFKIHHRFKGHFLNELCISFKLTYLLVWKKNWKSKTWVFNTPVKWYKDCFGIYSKSLDSMSLNFIWKWGPPAGTLSKFCLDYKITSSYLYWLPNWKWNFKRQSVIYSGKSRW